MLQNTLIFDLKLGLGLGRNKPKGIGGWGVASKVRGFGESSGLPDF